MSDAVVLPARLDLPAAVELVNTLRERSGPVAVDASAVTHLGALGLQALVAASRAIVARGDSFEIRDPSDRFTAHATTMGVAPDTLAEGTI